MKICINYIRKEVYNLSKYRFEMTETLQRIVTIEATDEKEAYEIISNWYKNEEIILNSEYFNDFEINTGRY